MRKIITAFILAASSATNASERGHDECKSWSNIAAMVMEQRQKGRQMAVVVDEIRSLELDDQMENAVRKMASMAYKHPVCGTDECREKSINEFSSTWYMACTDN